MARTAGQIQTPVKLLLGPIFRFAWRIHVEGAIHVPRTGAAIIAPNHTSVLDSFFVPLVLKRRITYVGKAEYLDDWKTRLLFPAMGMIPIDRSGGDASARALDASADVLAAGELFGIYPEGTRSRTGHLHRGHTGVARLALRTHSPIIPVGIVGSADIQPPDAKLPRPFRELTIRFGAPIDVRRYQDRAADPLVLRQITDELMYEIRNLSGQHYIDQYATKQHESIPTEPAVVGATVSVTTATDDQHSSGVDHEVAEAEAHEDPTSEGVGDPRSSTEVLRARPLVDLVNL